MTSDCLVPLPYETRNLAMASFAISETFLEQPDDSVLTATLADATRTHGKLFVQARLTLPAHLAAQSLLSRHGFLFMETALSPHCHLSRNQVLAEFRANRLSWLPQRAQQQPPDVTVLDRSNHDERAAILAIAGESFISDRFHLDPCCPAGAADRRYVLWVEDMLAGDTTLELFRYHGEVAGFMARSGQQLLLAGFARKYAMSGLGDYCWLSIMERMAAEGHDLITTQISTNNLPVLNMYARLGFKFRTAAALFHYWQS